ncbi:hypothetical protein [Sphingomonas sp.]|uniref:hypothetical protein n=1 Tax=Sphingomonas sp. TaxID=28214 RepID=UPI0025E475A6|nr:hypothetical protein [Sphingomonas sp.]
MILTYAPSPAGAEGLTALFALDDRLAETVRTTSEPMLGQIRLQWWHDALIALDSAAAPPEPVLQAIAERIVAAGTPGSALAPLALAWQVLLQSELGPAEVDAFAQRGRTLFGVAATVLGARADAFVAAGGEGWALADLAGKLSDPREAGLVRAAAAGRLDRACAARWPRALRPLGAMAHLARLDLSDVSAGSPRRVARALWHRLTGR